MLETLAATLIAALVIGVVASAFTRPILYRNKIQPLMTKLGTSILIFAVGVMLGSGIDFHDKNDNAFLYWIGLFAIGLIFQWGSLILTIITDDIETDSDGKAK